MDFPEFLWIFPEARQIIRKFLQWQQPQIFQIVGNFPGSIATTLPGFLSLCRAHIMPPIIPNHPSRPKNRFKGSFSPLDPNKRLVNFLALFSYLHL